MDGPISDSRRRRHLETRHQILFEAASNGGNMWEWVGRIVTWEIDARNAGEAP